MLLFSILTLAAWADPTKDYPEPPELYFLEAGSKRLSLEIDKPVSLDEFNGAKSATLRVKPYREFTHMGLKFRYPREYVYSCKVEVSGLVEWGLRSGNCNITLFHWTNAKNDKEFLEAIQDGAATAMKKRASTIVKSTATLKTAGKVVRGSRLEVELPDQVIIQDYFSGKKGNDVFVLLLTDIVTEPGKPSKERKRVEQMLTDSFEWPSEAKSR